MVLEPQRYLEHIGTESRRFRDVLLDCDPTARVPSCPDWTADDLLWHLVGVQEWWSDVVTHRPAAPGESDRVRPPTHHGLLDAFDRAGARLQHALASADPSEEAWTWSQDPAHHTVAFILRRQAHEALIHRLDAELAAGTSSPVDPALAADGVAEVLEVMYGGCPPWGSWTPSREHVRVDCTDTGDSLWLRCGRFSGTDPRSGEVISDEPDIHVVDPPDDGAAQAVVSAPAGLLDAWLWHRAEASGVHLQGDRGTLDLFLAAVAHPIN